MNRTNHIAQFESFREDPRIGTPNPNAGFREGSNDYTRGIVCIVDHGGGGLAVGTINNRSDAAYIRELEQYVPKDNAYGREGDDYTHKISIQVIPETGDGDNQFVCFEEGVFDIYGGGDNFKVPSGGHVFTITQGKFLTLMNGYFEYDLLTAKEVRDYFGG
jgi:hypothetical protein